MHNCPDCYQACYCSGDIDDIELGEPPAGCDHECTDDIDDDEWDDGDYSDER